MIMQSLIMNKGSQDPAETMNLTEEMLSVGSVTRQLGDQLTLAKTYVVMAKENNNLEFAWELSVQIRACQELLSKSATQSSHPSIGGKSEYSNCTEHDLWSTCSRGCS